MDYYSLPGSSVHGISQARTPEWFAISFSRASSKARIKTVSSALAGRSFTTEPPGKSMYMHIHVNKCINTYKWIIFLNVVISYMFAVKCIFSLQICKFVNNIWGGDIWWVLTFFPINLIWKYLVLWLSIAKWRLTLTLSALEHQSFCLTSVQSLSRVQLFATPVLQHTGLPCL